MKGIPMIKSVMTPFPYFVDMDDDIGKAETMMAEHDIGHLPVIEGGRLVSVISGDDILQVKKTVSPRSGNDPLLVRDGCESEVYIVELTERLDAVLLHMARTHIDCTLVVKKDRLVGIFTMRDACRCFGKWLRRQFSGGDGHDAA
ncbi:MAG: CBS domain-containing protein [Gammaproteobacteria bacterium]